MLSYFFIDYCFAILHFLFISDVLVILSVVVWVQKLSLDLPCLRMFLALPQIKMTALQSTNLLG